MFAREQHQHQRQEQYQEHSLLCHPRRRRSRQPPPGENPLTKKKIGTPNPFRLDQSPSQQITKKLKSLFTEVHLRSPKASTPMHAVQQAFSISSNGGFSYIHLAYSSTLPRFSSLVFLVKMHTGNPLPGDRNHFNQFNSQDNQLKIRSTTCPLAVV